MALAALTSLPQLSHGAARGGHANHENRPQLEDPSFIQGVPAELEDLDPEMTSVELRARLDSLRQHQNEAELSERQFDAPLEEVLAAGKRNLEWISFINQARKSTGQQSELVLNSPATQAAFPIESPSVSNAKLVMARFHSLMNAVPAEMGSVLTGAGAYPKEPPLALSDEQFLELARRLDKIYSSASRWLLEEPFLWRYQALAWKDVRGFYFLSRTLELESKLTHYRDLDSEARADLKTRLVGQCLNAREGRVPCQKHFSDSLAKEGNALAFYQLYHLKAQAVFDSFFIIKNPRKDTNWDGTSAPEIFTLPFLKGETSAVQTFLLNIEDEWRWVNWHLRLNFADLPPLGAESIPHLTFQPGATAHVNGLGGNQITMDSNRPLTDYAARWTIRHEFGHVVGFPDCYQEFYDEDQQAMINYQLDTTNLMCSRQGKFQERHYVELKRVYGGL